MSVRATLETHYRDMQDIEFTVQQGKLYMLQTRTGKRTAPAALKIAVDMANDGVIDKEEAIRRIEPQSLDQLLHPTLDPKAQEDGAGARPAGLAGRGLGHGRVLRRRGRGARRQGRGGDPGAHRDQPRGHSRHARRAAASSPRAAA